MYITLMAETAELMIRDVVASHSMATTGLQVLTQVDPVTVFAKPSIFTVTHILPVHRVTHASEKARIMETRVIILTVIAMVTDRTVTFVKILADIPTGAFILAGCRSTGVVVSTIFTKVTDQACTFVFILCNVSAKSTIFTRLHGTRVIELTGRSIESSGTETLVLSLSDGLTAASIITETRNTDVAEFTRLASIAMGTAAGLLTI